MLSLQQMLLHYMNVYNPLNRHFNGSPVFGPKVISNRIRWQFFSYFVASKLRAFLKQQSSPHENSLEIDMSLIKRFVANFIRYEYCQRKLLMQTKLCSRKHKVLIK